jgi:hypothetical protein
MRTVLAAIAICSAAVAGYVFIPATAAPGAAPTAEPAAPTPEPSPPRLVVHEWGTFTSFSGADGVPVGFRPNNNDLPSFVYYPYDQDTKAGRLLRGGLVSMETPVVYFYTDRDTRASVTVDFPRGWITEWYPFAAGAPSRGARSDKTGGQSIRWDVKLTPHEPARFPREKGENHYYAARETDAVPLQAEATARDEDRDYALRGGSVLQRERFLFYRGVGTFPPPVTVRATGGGEVRVVNGAGGTVSGLVLLTVRGGKVGFRTLSDLAAGAEATATLPEATGNVAELGDAVAKSLTAAGLYEREARAMVKSWDHAWFREEGTRLLYLVPRARTDELLPLKVDPKPTDVVRVLVGRHDFLTPEQEADAARQLGRVRAAQAELEAAERELHKLGRFAPEARQLVGKRLAAETVGQK